MFPFNDTSLSYDERMKDLLYRLTIDEKIHMMTTHHFPVERLNIGEWYVGTEIARGFVGRTEDMKSTVFPQPIGMASMFDTEIMERIGKVASDEARAFYNENKTSYLAIWGPTVDMERHPLWGRTEEAYGEDPCLTGKMTTSYTKGLIGEDKKYYKTLPTLKHFCGNNNEYHRGSSNSNIPKRLLHEYYYKAFEPSICFGGAKSIMTAYNEINHCPATMNTDIKHLLKDKWGLKYVVTDGGDFSQNVVYHKFCKTHAEAVAYSLKAGIDCFTDNDDLVHKAIYLALNERLITVEDIDKAIYNALFCRMKLGHFDCDCPYNHLNRDNIDTPEARALNLEASQKGMTLLKNDGLLPLDTSKSVAVIGFLADTMLLDWYTGLSTYRVTSLDALKKQFKNITFDNGFDIVAIKCPNGKYLSTNDDGTLTASSDNITISEQFELHDWGENWNNLYSIKLGRYVRICDDNSVNAKSTDVYGWFTKETLNFKEVFNSNQVIIEEYLHHRKLYIANDNTLKVMEHPQNRVDSNQKFTIETISKGSERVANLVKDYDYSIVFCGNDPEQYARECHDRHTLELPPQQSEIIKTSYENNKNTVLVVVSSYPYAINWENDNLSAILYTSHAGAELGNAVCDTLIGRNNPAGRTPMTWYKSLNDIPDIMEYDIENGGLTYMYYQGKALYPFGYGLSYSNFEYSNMECVKVPYGFKVSLDITNLSNVDGDEVVQFYYNVINSKVTRPLKKLFDFQRVHIKAKETITIVKEYNMLDHKDNCYFEFFDISREIMTIEDADYNIMIGSSSKNIKSTFTVHIDGEKIPSKNAMHKLKAINCDETSGTSILYAKDIDRFYLYSNSWNGIVLFKNCYLSNANYLQVILSSIFNTSDVIVKCDGKEIANIKVNPSNSFDDFTEYTIMFDKPIDNVHDIEICLKEGVSLLYAKFFR
ncbi:MAG: glycoside hydrolase family 3 C-terminal domain-containing protein [Oscillospiraceae bacterium]